MVAVVCAFTMKACDSEASRYVLKPVPTASLSGTWYVSQSSLPDMSLAAGMPGAAEFFPWQMLQLNPDGTFAVNGRIVSQGGRLQTVPETASGSWEVVMDTPVYGARPSTAAMVELKMETQGANGLRHVSVERLTVMDDAGHLVLWIQIGDLDARQYQEYVRQGTPLAQVDE